MPNYNVTPWADLHTMPGRWLARLAVTAGQREERTFERMIAGRDDMAQTHENRRYWGIVTSSVELAIGDRLLTAEA